MSMLGKGGGHGHDVFGIGVAVAALLSVVTPVLWSLWRASAVVVSVGFKAGLQVCRLDVVPSCCWIAVATMTLKMSNQSIYLRHHHYLKRYPGTSNNGDCNSGRENDGAVVCSAGLMQSTVASAATVSELSDDVGLASQFLKSTTRGTTYSLFVANKKK